MYRVSKLTSSYGKPYLGFLFDQNIVPWEQQIPANCVANKKRRDQHNHVTLINTVDYQPAHDTLIGAVAELKILGLGTATDGVSTCYFIAIDSTHAQALLRSTGLPPKDLHLTLGFTDYDVHGVSKKPATP